MLLQIREFRRPTKLAHFQETVFVVVDFGAPAAPDFPVIDVVCGPNGNLRRGRRLEGGGVRSHRATVSSRTF